MKKMDWKKLKLFDCPYCGSHLNDAGAWAKCGKCRFKIPYPKLHEIRERRKIQWQALHGMICPACLRELEEISYDRRHTVIKCKSELCDFSMGSDTFDRMMSDPNHAVNRYKDVPLEQ